MPKPKSARAQQELAQAHQHFEAGRFSEAVKAFGEICARQKQNAEARYMLGASQLQIGMVEQARDTLEEAIKRKPNVARYYYDLGMTYRALADFDKAIEVFDRMLLLSPGHEWGLAGKAEILRMQGNAQDAIDLLQPAVDKGIREIHAAVTYADLCLSLKRYDDGITVLRPFADDDGVMPAHRILALFRLADLLRSSGRDDDAITTYIRANTFMQFPYNGDAIDRAVDATIAHFTPERLASMAVSENESDRPIFILGMPRSGTSLLEQILDAHPACAGAGELDTLNMIVDRVERGQRVAGLAYLQHPQMLSKITLNQGATRYLAHLDTINADAAHVTDKMPTNFLHLGLIDRMFPNARVIHCVRDPMDTCLSCFMQHFGGVHSYCYDLTNVGHFYRAYHRLMTHWKSVLSIPILDVVYEDVIADQEAQTRRMLDFLDLPWDDACLEFHKSERIAHTASVEQVRQPIYRTAMKRWKKYEAHLGPMKGALGDLVVEK